MYTLRLELRLAADQDQDGKQTLSEAAADSGCTSTHVWQVLLKCCAVLKLLTTTTTTTTTATATTTAAATTTTAAAAAAATTTATCSKLLLYVCVCMCPITVLSEMN